MPTLTVMSPADRERARAKAVEILERAARSVLALGMCDNPKAAELCARITNGNLTPRVEVRLSGSLPLVVVWADDESGEDSPLWLFSVSDGKDQPNNFATSRGSSEPPSRLN